MAYTNAREEFECMCVVVGVRVTKDEKIIIRLWNIGIKRYFYFRFSLIDKIILCDGCYVD